MRITSAQFEVSAPNLGSCPHWALPEFALIGRSNVGKSSLLNAVTNRRDLARVSATPGKTQLINFFRVNGSWSLVDLPGYGYAKVTRERRLEFNAVVADYLAKRDNLRRVFVLIDSRLGPQAIDLEFLRWLETARVQHTLVFTKTDKQSASQTRLSLERFKGALLASSGTTPEILTTSSKTGEGCQSLLRLVQQDLG